MSDRRRSGGELYLFGLRVLVWHRSRRLRDHVAAAGQRLLAVTDIDRVWRKAKRDAASDRRSTPLALELGPPHNDRCSIAVDFTAGKWYCRNHGDIGDIPAASSIFERARLFGATRIK